MFKPKLPQQEQGFTLVEVLVAILITTLFVAVSMQAMVLAAVFKSRAQEFAQATTWIQEDLENVKYLASRYKDETECDVNDVNNGYADGFRDFLIPGATNGTYSNVLSAPFRTKKAFVKRRTTTPDNTDPYNLLQISYDVLSSFGNSPLSSAAAAGTSTITVTSGTRFAVNHRLIIGSDPGIYRISAISGNTLTITPNLASAQSLGAEVANISPTSTGSTLSDNVAAKASSINVVSPSGFKVNNSLIVGLAPDTYKISAISGNSLTITPNLATAQLSGAAVIAVADSIANFYTEVIPNAALQCP